MGVDSEVKPTTYQRELAKLPKALRPLIERKQWAVWKWTQKPGGGWQKPPFMARNPQQHASVTDPTTWADYATALETVQLGEADGISYILTKQDPFGAFDLDHCRCTITNSIDVWAQNYLDYGRDTYQEVTPSGEGVRVWGLADGEELHRKFALEIDGKRIAVELFRHTNKALTISGYTLDPAVHQLTNVDKMFDWALVWAERRKAAAAPVQINGGNGFDSAGCKYTIEEIEQIVRAGAPDGVNRSDLFHTIVGHYLGCGWAPERIAEHLGQFEHGIAERYIAESRLSEEVNRSAGKFAKEELPGSSGWTGDRQPEQPEPDKKPDDLENEDHDGELDDDPELEGEDDDLDDADLDDEPPGRQPDLPQMYRHGDPDPRPLKSWLIKHLMSTTAHGLLSGQWGTGKTFIVFDLFASLMTGQPFLGHTVKRQCGVLLLAAEGADEIRLRLDAVVREKCGGMQRAPFIWYEDVPPLLAKGSVKTLIDMARQAAADIEKEFGLPLGIIGIDTVTASAGYAQQGAESDTAVGQAVMNVLKAVARAANCAVLGVDHLGKDITRGTRGAGSKEGSGDFVWYCLGDKQLNGTVTNTRLAIPKNRGGRQGMEHCYVLREVAAPELDEDGDPTTTMVVDWQARAPAEAAAPDDPWAQCRREDQRIPMLRLKRVLHEALAEHGAELPIGADGPEVRMVSQELVREQFYACTPADGTAEQKNRFRRQMLLATINRAAIMRLITVREIEDVAYLYLSQPNPQSEELEDD